MKRKPKPTGTTRCGCGRVISANKLMCKACGDTIVQAVNDLIRKGREQ